MEKFDLFLGNAKQIKDVEAKNEQAIGLYNKAKKELERSLTSEKNKSLFYPFIKAILVKYKDIINARQSLRDLEKNGPKLESVPEQVGADLIGKIYKVKYSDLVLPIVEKSELIAKRHSFTFGEYEYDYSYKHPRLKSTANLGDIETAIQFLGDGKFKDLTTGAIIHIVPSDGHYVSDYYEVRDIDDLKAKKENTHYSKEEITEFPLSIPLDSISEMDSVLASQITFRNTADEETRKKINSALLSAMTECLECLEKNEEVFSEEKSYGIR